MNPPSKIAATAPRMTTVGIDCTRPPIQNRRSAVLCRQPLAHVVDIQPQFPGLEALALVFFVGYARSRLLEHRLHLHEALGLDARLVVRALRAVRAVLGACSGLDRQQHGRLDHVGVEPLAVDAVGVGEQIVEGEGEELLDLLGRPVVP